MKKSKQKSKPNQWSRLRIGISLVLTLLLAYFVVLTVVNLLPSSELESDRNRLREQILGDDLLKDDPSEENLLQGDLPFYLEPLETNLTTLWTDDYTSAGELALHLLVNQDDDDKAGIFTPVSLVEGLSYQLSAQVFSPDGASGQLIYRVSDADGEETLYELGIDCQEIDDDWQELELSLSAPYLADEATSMEVGVILCPQSTNVDVRSLFVDNLSLVVEEN
ncbi:MAG: hypothetical protein AAFV93_08015 [Chloroflexota bacterium]